MSESENLSLGSNFAQQQQQPFRGCSRGRGGFSRGGPDFSNLRSSEKQDFDYSNFELDKLHLQHIEKSTTEEEFAKFIHENCNVDAVFTKFIHREGIDWWYCFQKFSSTEDAKIALEFLKAREFKGKRIRAMYARKKETMPSYQQKAQHQQQKNFQQNDGSGGDYQDYYQESYQDVSPHMSAPGSYRGGGSSYGRRTFNRGSGRRQHKLKNTSENEPFFSENAIADDDAPASNHYNRAPVSFPHQKFSHRGAANSSCRARGAMGRGIATDMDSNNNTAFPPSMRSRLGPKYSPKQQSTPETTSIVTDVPKPCGTYTKKEKKSDVFWISDLKFAEVRPHFKAKCIKVESSKNITLQVTSGQTNEQPTDLDSMLQSVGSSLKNISDPEPGRLCVARIQQNNGLVSAGAGCEGKAENTSQSSGHVLKRAVLLQPVGTSQLNSAEVNEGSSILSAGGSRITNLDESPPSLDGSCGNGTGVLSDDCWTVELVDSAEVVNVKLSNLFNIHKQLLHHPVTTFHACFSSFQVVAGEAPLEEVVFIIKEGAVANESIATYRALRVVYNWIDIELDLDGQGSMTELLFETNHIVLTETSHEWKRYSQLPEMTLEEDFEYIGTVTHVKSPAEFYVQLEQVTSSTATANQIECSSSSYHETERTLLYETLPSFEMPDIPNYMPFPFELVCAKVDNRWLRARVEQVCWWSSENTPETEIEVFCVDHGYSASVKVGDTRPIANQFVFHQESPTSDSESGSNGSCNQFIAAQAIKVSLPGAVEQKSSFTDESLDLFRSEVFRQKVKLKLHNPRSVHSPDPNECVVWKLSQPANCDESSECIEMDLLQICISKGIINIMGCRLPDVPPNAIKVEDIEQDILIGPDRAMTTSFDSDVTPTKREAHLDESANIASSYDHTSAAVPNYGYCQEQMLPKDLRKDPKPLHQFDEDSSTQFSSDYLDAQFNGVSEKYVEALHEEVVQLREKVEKLESEMEEMRQFKVAVTKQLTKFRNAFG